MNTKDIKKLIGTEFSYVFPDGDSIPCVVAAFDPKIGFTCLATGSLKTDRDEYDFSGRVDGNGNMCMIGVNRSNYSSDARFIKDVNEYTQGIKEGRLAVPDEGGQASCAF